MTDERNDDLLDESALFDVTPDAAHYVTTMPLLALRSAREYWLMPLVTTRPGSEVAATTWPPGHMQKL